jgi:hypothetical protein
VGLQIVSRQLKYEIEEQTFYITSVDEPAVQSPVEEANKSNGGGDGAPNSCRVWFNLFAVEVHLKKHYSRF